VLGQVLITNYPLLVMICQSFQNRFNDETTRQPRQLNAVKLVLYKPVLLNKYVRPKEKFKLSGGS